jgi:rod shape-determining protein MreC
LYRKQVRRRRAVLVALIVASLVLISISFSEADSGPLHSVQTGLSNAFTPIEEGAGRALKPARDLVNWVDETFAARGENDRLHSELEDARTRLVEAQDALAENRQLRAMLELGKRPEVGAYAPLTARVIERSPTVWYAEVGIDKGAGDGVRLNDPVITGDGLIGRISDVSTGASVVQLITDHRSAVSARALPDDASDTDAPEGVVEPEIGDPHQLLLDLISGGRVRRGDNLVTAGWSNGQISSAYPPGLPIGKVTSVSIGAAGEESRVRVDPFADVGDLDYVQVLTGVPRRPGVPR